MKAPIPINLLLPRCCEFRLSHARHAQAKLRHVFYFRVGISPALLILLCLTPIATAQDKITYQEHIQPIFRNGCQICHNADQAKAGLDLSGYAGIMAGSSGGEVLVAGDPDASWLYVLVTHQDEPKMPAMADKLPSAQLDLIKKWIEGGLLENAASQAKKPDKPAFAMALTQAPTGKPDGPAPMPEHLLLEPVILTERPGAIAALAASPWAPLAAISGQKQVLLYHTDSLELLGVLPFPEGFPQTLSFSRTGSLLLAGGGRGGQSGRVVVWTVKEGRRVIEVGDEADAVLAADISADQTQIALGGPGRLVKIFATADGELLHAIKKHPDWVMALAYSPDGVLLASGDRNGGLYVWESFTGAEFYTLKGHSAAITGLSWRSDANLLASASEDGTIRLWEMFEGGQAKRWNAHAGGVLSVQFAQDGKLVSTGRDRQVKTWDQDGKEQKTFEAFDDLALQAVFTHDGRRVIAGDWTGDVRVWNVDDGHRDGELAANPPALAHRLEVATASVAQRQAAYDDALAQVSAAQFAAIEPAKRRDNAQTVAAQAAQQVQAAQVQVDQATTAAQEATAAHASALKERDNLKTLTDQHRQAAEKAAVAHQLAMKTHRQEQQDLSAAAVQFSKHPTAETLARVTAKTTVVLSQATADGADADDIESLRLQMKYEDGFVAYLNGQKVASGNAPDLPQWDSFSTAQRPDEQAVGFEDFDITAHLGKLQAGDNILAIHALNTTLDSTDLLIQPQLQVGKTLTGPDSATEWTTLLPEVAPCTTLVPADDALGLTWTETRFVDSGWDQGNTGVGYDYAGRIGLDVRPLMFNIHPTAYVRVPFTIGAGDNPEVAAEKAKAAQQQGEKTAMALAQAEQNLPQLIEALNAANEELTQRQPRLTQATTRYDQAAALLAKHQEETKPLEEKIAQTQQAAAQAREDLTSAQNQVAKWKAAQINVKLIAARGHMLDLQGQHNALTDDTGAAQTVHDQATANLMAAQKAFEDARARLAAAQADIDLAPQTIKQRTAALNQAQAGLQKAQTLENADAQELAQFQAQIDALAHEYQSALPNPPAALK